MKLQKLKKELLLPANQPLFTDVDLNEFIEKADELVSSATEDIKLYLACYNISQAMRNRDDSLFYKAKILAKLGIV